MNFQRPSPARGRQAIALAFGLALIIVAADEIEIRGRQAGPKFPKDVQR